MKVGSLVMLIGRDPDMPPCGSIGEIVGPPFKGDFDVEFPNHPCQVGESSWLVPPEWLVEILGDGIEHVAELAEAEPIGGVQ